MNSNPPLYNPFTGKDSSEVWRELRKIAVPVDKATAMKTIADRKEIIKK